MPGEFLRPGIQVNSDPALTILAFDQCGRSYVPACWRGRRTAKNLSELPNCNIGFMESRNHLPCAFTKQLSNSVYHWRPRENDDGAHRALRDFLGHLLGGRFPPQPPGMSTRLLGNFGEFITYYVGKECEGCRGLPYPANGLQPLADISSHGVDCAWIHFGNNAEEDWVVLQEVKASTTPDCQVARGLISDYDKLFGTTLTETLSIRLRDIKNRLEAHGHVDKGRRLNRFLYTSIRLMRDVSAIPTLVFDCPVASHDTAEAQLAYVRAAMIQKGWNPSRVEPWSICLGDLGDRIIRIAVGRD